MKEDGFCCTCADGTLRMTCPNNYGLHKRTGKWQVQVPALPAFTPEACTKDGKPDCRVKSNPNYLAEWTAGVAKCGRQPKISD